MKRAFKYQPEDFGDLTVDVQHMDLTFDMFDDHTDVVSYLKVKVKDKSITSLELNAKNLEIHEVSSENVEQLTFDYKKDEHKLIVEFNEEVAPGKEITIRTKTTCKPTANILEGLYFDETPKGCPCQQITQCQQWGFQRIVPCIDDMTAKCTYNTTIIADERYTNYLTNGDVIQNVTPEAPGRVSIRYENTKTPMATYLFFLGIGTYETFTKEFEYPDGKMFQLELLVPPGSDEHIAEQALQILYDAIMWVYLFTGRDTYVNQEKNKEILSLIRKRDELKRDTTGNKESLEEIRSQLQDAIKGMHFGYQYTGTVYREIGMQNSDYGGMENVGNTTITTNRIMPFPEMTDGSYEYMIRVKAHEYYHNLNGSEVTGRSPFEIWLNEAVTVFIEKTYHEYLFGVDYSRLQTILHIFAPGSGTLAEDESVASMPVEPDGFNDPNELITGMTYVKAPEFVQMIEAVTSKETFVRGLDLYHTRYKHSNASREQWIEAMEEASGMSLKDMAQSWLKQVGYPKVYVTTQLNADEKKCTVSLRQEGFTLMPWQFPFSVAACDAEGNVLFEKQIFVQNEKDEIVFEEINVSEVAFFSINRGYLMYGKVFHDVEEATRYLQVRKDTDIINKYLAFYALADAEKTRLLKDSEAEVSSSFIELYFELLSDEQLMREIGSQILALFESVEDSEYKYAYQELYDVKKKIQKALALRYTDELKNIYELFSVDATEGSVIEKAIYAIKARSVKNHCLGLLSTLDEPSIWEMIKQQWETADNATDKVLAFGLYIDSSAPDKKEIIALHEEEAIKSLVSWETYLAMIASCNADDAIDLIRSVQGSKHFRLSQSNDQRALLVRFVSNRKKSLLTSEGREYLKEILLTLAKVNEYTSGHVLKMMSVLAYLKEEDAHALITILLDVLEELKDFDAPSVKNTIKRILQNSGDVFDSYQKKNGAVELKI